MLLIMGLSPVDSTGFYSGVAQVASSFVGFLGGFFVIRLQNYAQEWRELRLEIERLSIVHESTTGAYSQPAAGGASSHETRVLADLSRRNEDALRELAPLLYRREHSRFPGELVVQSVLLVLLTALGVWVPLSLLDGPSSAKKMLILGPVILIVMILWVAMFIVAVTAWRRLRKPVRISSRKVGRGSERAQ